MTSLRKVAVTSVAGIALALGVAACEQSHPQDVPGSAQLMQAGNKQVVFTPNQRGMVYVYDQQNNHLIWSGEVSEGRQIKVDPTSNQITVNGQVVSKGTLLPYHNEQVWFSPESSRSMVAQPTEQSGSSTYYNSSSNNGQYSQ